MSKKGYEFSFAWLFTILVGAMIIFLAVYITTQIVGTRRLEQETLVGKQLGILISPVETNLEQAKFAVISLNPETKLINECDSERGTFGSQDISAKVSSGIGKKWTDIPGIASSFHNKYLFSEKEVYGKKEFYVLSKPFKFPFKLADFIIIWPDTKNYCFEITSASSGSAQAAIKKEIEELKLKNIQIGSCPAGSMKVCFSGTSGTNCNISVDLANKKVTHKNQGAVFYAESFDNEDKYALLYAAIFSEPEVYECQIKRLAARASELALINKEKSEFLTAQRGGCSSAPVLPKALEYFRTALASIDSSSDLDNVRDKAEELKQKNDVLICKVF